MTPIDRIRQKIRTRDYFLSSHAEDEMVDDFLERNDVENAILTGRIEKVMTHDDRGNPLPNRRRYNRWTTDSRHRPIS